MSELCEVCGKMIKKKWDRWHTDNGNRTVYFCSEKCAGKFDVK